MSSTLSRCFPPPSLAGVPFEYILDQLHNLAPFYWNNSANSDCTIVIPVPHLFRHVHLSARPSYNPSGRRATEPNTLALLPRITLKMHSDYLSAHSSFLRSMFSGASPFDLINTSSNMRPTPNSPLRTPSGRFTIPFDRLPRLLNSSPDHPVLFLPVPDPSSIDLLFHWMYFGELDLIRDALHNGTIHWEGVARNVEYLGLADDIKVFLGNWYLRWIHPTLHHSQSTGAMYTEQSDTEYESDEDDDDEDNEEPSSAHDSMGSGDTLVELEDNDLNIQTCDYEAKRGRDRAVRGLSWNLQYAEKFPDASMPISRREESPIPPDCIITPS